ncbi:hypothetical protein ACQP1O_20435 [Nocardia sp. CA-151230]|uniref:hypothetical protein n=1 Tax=Nocardia sp. CA-151230 TaxID=3239982 RepID=UPI003D8EF249
MGAFAEFGRSLIRERRREGIAAAQARGVYTGREHGAGWGRTPTPCPADPVARGIIGCCRCR